MKNTCRATGAMPLLQWFLELFGYKPKDKFATPKKKKRPSKLDINEFQMFWHFFHHYSYVAKLNKRTAGHIWDGMPRHKKDRAYSLDTVIMYRNKHIQCDEYLTEVNKIF